MLTLISAFVLSLPVAFLLAMLFSLLAGKDETASSLAGPAFLVGIPVASIALARGARGLGTPFARAVLILIGESVLVAWAASVDPQDPVYSDAQAGIRSLVVSTRTSAPSTASTPSASSALVWPSRQVTPTPSTVRIDARSIVLSQADLGAGWSLVLDESASWLREDDSSSVFRWGGGGLTNQDGIGQIASRVKIPPAGTRMAMATFPAGQWWHTVPAPSLGSASNAVAQDQAGGVRAVAYQAIVDGMWLVVTIHGVPQEKVTPEKASYLVGLMVKRLGR